jgi:hypothetical protein
MSRNDLGGFYNKTIKTNVLLLFFSTSCNTCSRRPSYKMEEGYLTCVRLYVNKK